MKLTYEGVGKAAMKCAWRRALDASVLCGVCSIEGGKSTMCIQGIGKQGGEGRPRQPGEETGCENMIRSRIGF